MSVKQQLRKFEYVIILGKVTIYTYLLGLQVVTRGNKLYLKAAFDVWNKICVFLAFDNKTFSKTRLCCLGSPRWLNALSWGKEDSTLWFSSQKLWWLFWFASVGIVKKESCTWKSFVSLTAFKDLFAYGWAPSLSSLSNTPGEGVLSCSQPTALSPLLLISLCWWLILLQFYLLVEEMKEMLGYFTCDVLRDLHMETMVLERNDKWTLKQVN